MFIRDLIRLIKHCDVYEIVSYLNEKNIICTFILQIATERLEKFGYQPSSENNRAYFLLNDAEHCIDVMKYFLHYGEKHTSGGVRLPNKSLESAIIEAQDELLSLAVVDAQEGLKLLYEDPLTFELEAKKLVDIYTSKLQSGPANDYLIATCLEQNINPLITVYALKMIEETDYNVLFGK